jgi:hypothetical protein
MDTDQLIASYTEISVREDEAIDMHQMRKVRRLFDQLMVIKDVLRARGPDARRALIPLLSHRNAQVRLNAAKELMAVVPEQARATLEDIAENGPGQQSGDSGMFLRAIDEGEFRPT